MSEKLPEDTLKELRAHETLADMDKKFGVTRSSRQVAIEQNKSKVPAGFQDALRELTERNNAFRAYVETLPREKFVISSEELDQIKEIMNLLRLFLEKHENGSKQVSKENQLFYEKGGAEKLITQLDGLGVWRAKFATECSGGAGSDVPLQEYNHDTDSLYYMTPSGATMRIKIASLVNGLRVAVQPFTEKVVFEGQSGEISESPQEGSRVVEYWSDQFRKAVMRANESTYQSGLEIYRRGNSIEAISHNDERGNKSFSPAHEGDRVNRIFFLR